MKLITARDLDSAAGAVEAGELVIVPTLRWYMICANANDADACQRIFTGKKRPTSKPLALVVPSTGIAHERPAPTYTATIDTSHGGASRTRLHAHDVAGIPGAALAISLRVTDCALIHRPARRHAGVLWFADPHSESWATLSYCADTDLYDVRQAGPRQLWDEIETAHRTHEHRTRPCPGPPDAQCGVSNGSVLPTVAPNHIVAYPAANAPSSKPGFAGQPSSNLSPMPRNSSRGRFVLAPASWP